MNRSFLFAAIVVLVLLAAAGVLMHPQPAAALPEYSAQTGEPCASCHLSPSGGGPRGPRGQAWVGSGKPGTVPNLIDSLSLLGIRIEMDEALFQPPTVPPEAGKLPAAAGADAEQLRMLLHRHDGN